MKTLLVTSLHFNHTVFHQGLERGEGVQYAQRFVPMGLLSLAGAIETVTDVIIEDLNKSVNCHILPMSRHFYPAAAERLLSLQPDVVGFMTDCDSYHHTLRICKAIKERRPSVLTVLGGTHASASHERTLRSFLDVDFVIRGEGELAFKALLETLQRAGDFKEVGNLSYRAEDGKIISTADFPLLENLDDLPWPDFSRIKLEPQDVIYLEIGRGCPFKCNFCFTAPYWKRRHRIKSPDRILGELAYLKDSFGRSDFNFTHDLFTTDRRWVIDFCRRLHASELQVTWTCSSRTDTIDEELIYWLQLAGCRDIYFGVETGTTEMQTAIDKNLDLDQADYIIGKTNESGIGVTVGFISGLPGESEASLRGTLKKAVNFLRLSRSTVHLFGFGPYRGSSHFDDIVPRLVFDPHFVDFPLSDEVHSENCALMEEHFDIFARYSRLSSYSGLDVESLRAAEEFFPIVNALRSLVLALTDKQIDPLELLRNWSVWISRLNATRGRSTARLYQGRISDFLDFVATFLAQRGPSDPVLDEHVRWERHKDKFRSRSYPEPQVADREETGATLFTNPSATMDRFEHAKEFLNGVEGTGLFAFYARRDGTPMIARVHPLAQLMLDFARRGTTEGSLLTAFERSIEAPARPPALHRWLLGLLKRLVELELLLPAAFESGDDKSVKADAFSAYQGS